jgi:hypothetical protein
LNALRTGAIASLLLLAGPVCAALAQQAPEPPNISLRQFMQSAPPRPVDSITRDDLHNVPAPPVDRFPQNVRFHVVVGDPRCEPGEDWFDDSPRPRLPSSRRR